MKHVRLASLFFILSLLGCGSAQNTVYELSGQTMGTTFRVSYASPAGEIISQESVDALLQDINASMSTYIDGSLISRLNESRDTTQSHTLDEHFVRVFNESARVHEATGGRFNPALGPLIRAWGFGKDDPRLLDASEVEQLLPATRLNSFNLLAEQTLKKSYPESELDFGGIAKGYAVDEVGRLLERSGVQDYLIEIGGEVRARGAHPEKRPWRIGIEKPLEAFRDFEAIVSLNDRSMATSGNYRNFYWLDGQKIVHTMNPETGYPETNSLLSVTVATDDCMTADAYATAFMVMGLEAAIAFVEQQDELDVMLIYGSDAAPFETYLTPGFEDMIEEEAQINNARQP